MAGTPDAIEIVRLACDLGRLRGHAAPGRGELLEAIETCLVQGDLFGRGRAVAAAAQAVFVGEQRGRLPKGTPRSGLAVQIEAAITRLKLAWLARRSKTSRANSVSIHYGRGSIGAVRSCFDD